MAITTSYVYGATIAKMLNYDTGFSWDAGAWRASLVLESHTPDKTDDFRDDIDECTGQSAVTITTTAASFATATVTCDVSDTTWTFTGGITTSEVAGGVLIYCNVGTAATDPILCLLDFTGDNTITGDGTTDIVITVGSAVFTGST